MGLGTEHQPGVLARGMGFAALLGARRVIAIRWRRGSSIRFARSGRSCPATPQGLRPRPRRTSSLGRVACRTTAGARVYHPCRWRGSRSGARLVSTPGAPGSRGALREDELFTTISGCRGRAAVDAGDVAGRLRPRPRLSGVVPVHAGRLPVDVPGAAVDDAPVRGLRDGGGDERAVPVPARPRADGALLRVRHAGADGGRLRLAAGARRGRARGRGGGVARGHGDPLLGDPARRGVDVDDDQLGGGDRARDVPRGRRGAGRAARAAPRDDPDGHPQGVHRAEGVHLPARARRCGS